MRIIGTEQHGSNVVTVIDIVVHVKQLSACVLVSLLNGLGRRPRAGTCVHVVINLIDRRVVPAMPTQTDVVITVWSG